MSVMCEACLRAAVNPQTGRYTAQCRECEARSLANTPAYSIAARADAITVGYRDALMTVFGQDHWRSGHVRVKYWAEKIEAARDKE